MKLQSSLALLLAGVAVKAVPPPLRFQNNAEPLTLPDLTTQDFQTIQLHFKETFEHATEHFSPPDTPVSNEDDESEVSIPNPFPHHPPPVIDFSHRTILEIINASLGHHHEEEHRKIEPRFRLFAGGDDQDPSHLPLHRLAWLVNFSSETQEYLKSDDITLLAPDDQALTPPHRRGGEHGHPHGHSEPMLFGADRHDLDKSHLAHPFHSKEFSPEKLHKLSGEDGDDKDKERKREIFRKIISYVGKYHVLPGRRQGHDLAEVSTAATLIEDSRVNVRPGFDFFPLPHPTLKFNYYSSKRGPTVLAKNGVIHLVSAPLFPPFTPLSELFLFPAYFSSLTSDIQKVDLAEALLPSHDHDLEEEEEEEEEESSLVDELVDELIKEKGLKEFTVFAPGNFAFARVPAQILAGLHSPFPFAKKVLKYVIAGHVVPDTVFFSDFLKNDTGSSSSIDKFFVSQEVDVQVPFEWLEDSHNFPAPAFEQVAFKTKEWKMPSFPPRRGRAVPPPPPPPGREQHCNANVTHYELPTLLTADNANATLKVAVVSYRAGPGGKGPLKRSIVVFPQRPPHHHEGEHDDVKTKMCPGHEDPFRPIKVTFSDLPAKSGAIHTLPRIIPPPPPPHHDDGDHKHFSEDSLIKLSSKHEAKKLRKALARLF